MHHPDPTISSFTSPLIEQLEDRILFAVVTVSSASELLSAVNSGSNNDTVIVKAGTYQVTQSLKPKAGMTIVGAGEDQTFLEVASSWSPAAPNIDDDPLSTASYDRSAYFFDLGNRDNITLSGLGIDGEDRLHGAIWGNDADDFTLSDSTIRDFLWSGVRTWRSDGHAYLHNEFLDAGGRVTTVSGNGVSGGMMNHVWFGDAEIAHNYFEKSNGASNVFGIKGIQYKNTRIHHNTLIIPKNAFDNFAMEIAFGLSENVEIDHNYIDGTVSVPKDNGGYVIPNGYTFHIHNNYFTQSYSIEGYRSDMEINHNLFDFSTNEDNGRLISNFYNPTASTATGPMELHNNLIKNPGRGVIWMDSPYNNVTFRNNEIIGNTTINNRTAPLFDIQTSIPNGATTDFTTHTIKDNIITLNGTTRDLIANSTMAGTTIVNNTLNNVSNNHGYSNPNTGNLRGLETPLFFTLGADNAYTVDGWDIYDTAESTVTLTPTDDAYVRGGTHANTNYGTSGLLRTKDSASSGSNNNEYQRYSYIKFDVSNLNSDRSELQLSVSGAQSGTTFPITLRLYRGGDSWSEGAITWNNRPSMGSQIATATVNSVGQVVSFDVTDYVREQAGTDGYVTFVVGQIGANRIIDLSSKEGNIDPKLIVSRNGTSPMTQAAIADAYVRDGSFSSENYGDDTKLRTKDASNATYDRWSYVKFELDGTAGDGQLELTPYNIETPGQTIRVYATSDGWTESGITWSNKPSVGSQLASATVNGEGQTLRFDVGNYVSSQRSGDGIASFAIRQTGDSNKMIDFASRENTEFLGPTLIFGAISVNDSSVSGNYNLTSLGTLDWAKWGRNATQDFDRKNSGGNLIGDWSAIGGGHSRTFDSSVTHSWSDGTPTSSATNNQGMVRTGSSGAGFRLNVDAATTGRTLQLYLGTQYGAVGQLTIRFADGSAPQQTLQITAERRLVEIDFSGASNTDLIIEYTKIGENPPPGFTGNIYLKAATLGQTV